MWFKRDNKKRNRRTGREFVLDVKLRSDQVRATRVRLATVIFCVLFGTFFGLYLLWRSGEVLLDKFVYSNPDFAVEKVEIQTDGVLLPEQLRQWSNVKIGANLIALNLELVKQNLELVSAVDSVSVERVLPHTLRIRVTERDPVAQVNMPCVDAAGNFAVAVTHLDKAGVAMKPRDPRDCVVSAAQVNQQLPVITGLNPVKLKLGQAVPDPDSARAQAALDLIRAFEHSPMAGLVDLRRVDISAPGVLVVMTGQGSAITFGLENFDQQMKRWRQIYDLGLRQQRAIASADLAVENNVPVRWASVGPASTTPPAPRTRPARTRRSNV